MSKIIDSLTLTRIQFPLLVLVFVLLSVSVPLSPHLLVLVKILLFSLTFLLGLYLLNLETRLSVLGDNGAKRLFMLAVLLVLALHGLSLTTFLSYIANRGLSC